MTPAAANVCSISISPASRLLQIKPIPELAEVEFFRKRWQQAAGGRRMLRVLTHDRARLYRGVDLRALHRALQGATLKSSATSAKQMLFHFSGGAWLGIHLGMSGELRAESANYPPQKHDHLVLLTTSHALVFNDPRMFGRIEFHVGPSAPGWWTRIAPPVRSNAFTVGAVAAFLRRRGRTSIKAVLLMQELFPGIGNWMADEVLWRAALHPRRLAGSLRPAEVQALWRECRRVCRLALDTIAGRGKYLPSDLNAHIPATWLFRHRWQAGGRCPKTKQPLIRGKVGGRTTCWSPARQKLR